jgi:hypothetical protein
VKIRLKDSLPLDPILGAVAGAEFGVIKISGKTGLHWMRGKSGDEFGAFAHEFEVLDAEPAAPVEAETVPEPVTPAEPAAPVNSDEEKIEAANEAITYFLERMRGHEKLLYHMNHTRSLELFCEAYAKLNGVTADRVEEFFTGRTEEL